MNEATAAFSLSICHLRFTVTAQTIIHFGPQAGAQLRGALWSALSQFACSDPMATHQPNHASHCPLCRLVALETADSARGRNPARPFAIQPPLENWDGYYAPGKTFQFGISLFGDTGELIPYIVQAVYRMGQIGVGYGRGRFVLEQAAQVNPLVGSETPLLEAGRFVASAAVPLTTEHIAHAAAGLPADILHLRFLTPTQLTHHKKLVNRPDFTVLLARLLERCQSLEETYSPQPSPQELWRTRYLHLTQATDAVQLVDDRTQWAKAYSGSRRSNAVSSISGFVGEAVYRGNLTTFREWLVWGQSLHVGKNAVKGNGWYQILL